MTRPGLRVLWVIGLAGGAAAALSVTLANTSDDGTRSGLQVALNTWISLAYVVGGLIAWRRRPDSRFGPLMVGAGFAFSLTTLQWANVALIATVGQLSDLLPAALFLHVVLAFPSGRLPRRPERLLVVAGYVLALGVQLGVLLLGGFDPRNLLAIVSRPVAAETVQNVQLVGLSGLGLAGVGVLTIRRLRERSARRRWTALLVDSFALGLVGLAALLLAGAFEWAGFGTLRLVTFAVIGLAPLAFLTGLVDSRLARSGVGDLLLELRADPNVDLRLPLARLLRDPSLTVAYWLPEYGRWADRDGCAVIWPDGSDGRAATVIDRDGHRVAALLHDRSLADERELLDAVAAAAGIAIENGRLQADLRARLQDVRGSRLRVVEAEQRERKRLESNLHDGAQQRLVALALELGRLEDRLAADSEARIGVGSARRELAMSLEELRDLARGIHPAVVTGHGLAVALESLSARAPVPLRLTVGFEGRLPEPVEVAGYYVTCESLANIGKHAQATSATVDVTTAQGNLVIEVVDDGVGGADTERGSGLRGIADRVEALGGRLRVWSPVGGGTRVKAEIPCG